MMKLKMSPVYCSHCDSFAVAEMAGTPRCWNCIYSEVCTNGKIEIDIAPLKTISEQAAAPEPMSQAI